MALIDRYDMDNLVNEAERLVLAELERQTEGRDDVCLCQDCTLDMAAYALNHVKPYYRVSLLGSLYAQNIEGTEYANEVKRAVTEAIEKVQANRSHDG